MRTSIRQTAQVEWFRDNIREERLKDMYRGVIVDASLLQCPHTKRLASGFPLVKNIVE